MAKISPPQVDSRPGSSLQISGVPVDQDNLCWKNEEIFQLRGQQLRFPEVRARLDDDLIRQGVALVPRPRGTKVVSFGFRDYYDKEPASLDEVRSWKDLDRAAICGINDLRVIEFDGYGTDDFWTIFDRYESWQIFYRFFGRTLGDHLVQNTLVVITSRGLQVFYFDHAVSDSCTRAVIDARPVLPVELFLHHHLASVPANLHPSGITYQMLGNDEILRKDGLTDQLIERLRSLGCEVQTRESAGLAEVFIAGSIDLTDEQKQRVAEILVQLWHKGERHKVLVGFAGWFLRLGISEESAARFISSLAVRLEPTWKMKLEEQKVTGIYNTALRNKNAHIPGLSTLLQVSKNHKREDLAQKLVELNRSFRRTNRISVETQSWLSKRGYA